MGLPLNPWFEFGDSVSTIKALVPFVGSFGGSEARKPLKVEERSSVYQSRYWVNLDLWAFILPPDELKRLVEQLYWLI